MSISGHKTVSMFLRSNITSGADKIDALQRTAEHLAAQPKKTKEETVIVLEKPTGLSPTKTRTRRGQSHLIE